MERLLNDEDLLQSAVAAEGFGFVPVVMGEQLCMLPCTETFDGWRLSNGKA